MAQCNVNVVELPCNKGGFSYLDKCFEKGSTKLVLKEGGALNFPSLAENEVFYVIITSCEVPSFCCEIMRVTAIEGDVFTVERDAEQCDSYVPGSRVAYLLDSVEVFKTIARSVGLTVVAPLEFDPCTNTLSIDCGALPMSGCGCSGGGGGSGEQGPPGPKGKDGKDGVSITAASVNTDGVLSFSMSDGSTITSAGVVRGPIGEQGPRGDPGEQGPRGDPGEQGVSVTTIVLGPNNELLVQLSDQDTPTSVGTITVPAGEGFSTAQVDGAGDLIITKTNNSTFNAGHVVGPQGPVGETALYSTVISGTTMYIVGVPGAVVTVYAVETGSDIGPYTIGSNGTFSIANPLQGAPAQAYYLRVGGKYVAAGKHG